MTTPWHLAIDFGTSNTAAAHTSASGGRVETVALTHHGALMPSAVYADADGIEVGHVAVNRAERRPECFLASPKRLMEHDEVPLGDARHRVADLVGAVLRRVVDVASSRHDGQPPASVTLTHPEAWPAPALANLRAAAAAAGIDDGAVHLVSEPRAAARLYALRDGGVSAGDHVAVFDFGAGTLDIAVLERVGADFRVVAARGDNSLGGRNVDVALRRHVERRLDAEHPAVADYLVTAPPSVALTLGHSVRQAKELLSDAWTATVTVSTPLGETNLIITRGEFEELLADDLDRAAALTRAALRDAGADPATTAVYLTGGSARIPLVQEKLAEAGRVATLDDPKTVVARGALMATASELGAEWRDGGAEGSAAPAPGAHAPARAWGGEGAVVTHRADHPQPRDDGDRPATLGELDRGRRIGAIAASVVLLVAAIGGGVYAWREGLIPGLAKERDTTATAKGLPAYVEEALPDRFAAVIDGCATHKSIYGESPELKNLQSTTRYECTRVDGNVSAEYGINFGPHFETDAESAEKSADTWADRADEGMLRKVHDADGYVVYVDAEADEQGVWGAQIVLRDADSGLLIACDSEAQLQRLLTDMGFMGERA
ncbi:Hsp70 family protein [Corynebacterium sp. 335C]